MSTPPPRQASSTGALARAEASIARHAHRAPKRAPAPPHPIAQRNLPLLLLQAREKLLGPFRPVLQAQGLTEQQWRILRLLSELGPLEPRQIVRAGCISSPSLAGVLARMDELGLVRRERQAGDLRRVKVSLTPRSRAVVAHMAPRIAATYQIIEARLGRAFVAGLVRDLDRVVQAMGDHDT